MSTKQLKPPFAYYGGKTRIAKRIAAVLPQHDHYVEPFAGGLSVLLAKPKSMAETVNDLDGDLMTFWRVLRDQPDELIRACSLTPHSRSEYLAAGDLKIADDVERARRVWVLLSQGKSGSLNARRGWVHYVDHPAVATTTPSYMNAYVDRMRVLTSRLSLVTLECRPAAEIIKLYGRYPKVCLYVDPPYLASSRSSPGSGYASDMKTEADHRELADLLKACTASVVLSSYDSPLYEELYEGWDQINIRQTTARSGKSALVKNEVVRSNRTLSTADVLDGILLSADKAV